MTEPTAPVLYPTDWARRPAATIARNAFRAVALLPFLRAFARLEVTGREHLEGVTGPVVISANHRSHADTVVLLAALPRRWRRRTLVGAAADYWFTGRALSAFSALGIGGYPVERRKTSAASARLTLRLLDEGWNIILFPEGGRSRDKQLLEMKPGAAFAAVRTGRPMVPVWLEGTEHVLAADSKRPRRGVVSVRFGPVLVPRPDERPRPFHQRFEAALEALQPGSSPPADQPGT